MTTKERITIMLNGEIAKKIRKKQSELIVKTNHTVSFSRVIELAVKKGLDKIEL